MGLGDTQTQFYIPLPPSLGGRAAFLPKAQLLLFPRVAAEKMGTEELSWTSRITGLERRVCLHRGHCSEVWASMGSCTPGEIVPILRMGH